MQRRGLPRINSGQDFDQPLESDALQHNAVVVPKMVDENKELSEHSESSSGASSQAREERAEGEAFLDCAVGVGLGKDEDDEYEQLGTSLIQSSLADQSPRWRMHDSQVGAVRDDGEGEPRVPSAGSSDSHASGDAEVCAPAQPAPLATLQGGCSPASTRPGRMPRPRGGARRRGARAAGWRGNAGKEPRRRRPAVWARGHGRLTGHAAARRG